MSCYMKDRMGVDNAKGNVGNSSGKNDKRLTSGLDAPFRSETQNHYVNK